MNTLWFSRVIGSFTGIVLLISLPIIAEAGMLNADEVRQLISGNTLVFEHAEGGRIQTRYYDANGTFRQMNKKGTKKQKGKWSINNNGQLCNQRKGKGVCHSIYQQGDVWRTYIDRTNPIGGDKHILTIQKVLEGNPNNF